VLGGLAGAAIIYLIFTGKSDFSTLGGFAANGYGEHSPGGYGLNAALISEVVMTFFFLIVISVRLTRTRRPALRPSPSACA